MFIKHYWYLTNTDSIWRVATIQLQWSSWIQSLFEIITYTDYVCNPSAQINPRRKEKFINRTNSWKTVFSFVIFFFLVKQSSMIYLIQNGKQGASSTLCSSVHEHFLPFWTSSGLPLRFSPLQLLLRQLFFFSFLFFKLF